MYLYGVLSSSTGIGSLHTIETRVYRSIRGGFGLRVEAFGGGERGVRGNVLNHVSRGNRRQPREAGRRLTIPVASSWFIAANRKRFNFNQEHSG